MDREVFAVSLVAAAGHVVCRVQHSGDEVCDVRARDVGSCVVGFLCTSSNIVCCFLISAYLLVYVAAVWSLCRGVVMSYEASLDC